jgi:hypothetical protein
MSGMKHIIILILILVITLPIFAQKGYYSSAERVVAGVEIINTGINNTYYCSLKEEDEVYKFSPYDIYEYGIKSGHIYKAFDVIIDGVKERYFLRHIVEGEIDLYHLKLKGGVSKFYLMTGDSNTLAEVNSSRDEARTMVSTFVDDCAAAAQNLKHLRPRKHSLTRYFKNLNSCSGQLFPTTQFGFRGGYTATQFFPWDKFGLYSTANYKSDVSFLIGAFIDIPIRVSNISFAPEVYFKENHYSILFSRYNVDYDHNMEFSSVNIPLLFKYRFPLLKYIPFIQAGPVYSMLTKNESVLYKSEIIDNVIFMEFDKNPNFQDALLGFSIGGGVIYPVKGRLKLFGETRYSRFSNDIRPLYDEYTSQNMFNLGELTFSLGVLF